MPGRRTRRGWRARLARLAAALTAPALVATTAAAAPVITEYPPHAPGATPCEIEFDPSGTAWVQEAGGNAVTRLDPATGTLTPFPLRTPAAQPGGMEFGPDGHLWFSEVAGNDVVRLDPVDGSMEYFPIPYTQTPVDGLPYGLRATIDASVRDGAVWFTLAGANAIGRFDMVTHAFTRYPLPTPDAVPLIIQHGPGHLLVFSEALGNRIGTIDTRTRLVREYPVPTPSSVPQGVTTAPDGTVWWSGTGGQQLGTLDVRTGRMTEIPLLPLRAGDGQRARAGHRQPVSPGNPLPAPGPLRFGTNGTVYFAEGNLTLGGDRIGAYDPRRGTLAEYPTPTPASGPCDLNNQNAGSIWFGEFTGNRVGRLTYGPS